jgi:aerobic carbon-monoxide dehydrogenase small subunit
LKIVRLRVNGVDHTLEIPADRLLIQCLREDLGLTGTKASCGVGVCGACSVRMNGVLVTVCLTLAVCADGAEIETIEGWQARARSISCSRRSLRAAGSSAGTAPPAW